MAGWRRVRGVWPIKILIALVGVLLLLRVLDPWPVETLRLKYFDALLTSQEPIESQSISLYNIGEAELARYGQWPWPRQELARINRELLDAGAAAVVYSVLFPEEDRFGGDEAFAGSMGEIPTFLSAVASASTDRQDGWQIGVATLGQVHENAINYPGILPNVPVLQAAATGTGVVNTAPEVDGLVRRIPMLVRVGESLYPALGLDVLRGLAGDPSYQARGGETGLQSVRIPAFPTIQTDPVGRVWLDWSAGFSPQPKANTVVFVGVTAAGVQNLVSTPRGLRYPHEIQATLLETLLTGTSPVRPDWALGAEVVAVAILGLITGLMAVRLPVPAVPAGVLAIGAVAATCSVLGYLRLGILVDAAYPVLSGLIVGSVGVGRRMLSEYQLKMQIKGQFSTYVSPDLVQELQDDPSKLVLGGETRYMTYLFADVVGFTPISEALQDDPQALIRLVNKILSRIIDVGLSLGGTLDKTIGDCCFFIWGAPLPCEQHERQAVRCAAMMLVALDSLNREMSAQGLPEIGLGVGVNSGLAVIGNMGSDGPAGQRFDYSAIGDAVNVAARLESSSRKYPQDVLIGGATARKVPGLVEYLDELTVKGKEEVLRVYTLNPEAMEAAKLDDYWVDKAKKA